MKTAAERKKHIRRWNGVERLQKLAVRGCCFGLALWLVLQGFIKCGAFK